MALLSISKQLFDHIQSLLSSAEEKRGVLRGLGADHDPVRLARDDVERRTC